MKHNNNNYNTDYFSTDISMTEEYDCICYEFISKE